MEMPTRASRRHSTERPDSGRWIYLRTAFAVLRGCDQPPAEAWPDAEAETSTDTDTFASIFVAALTAAPI
jgi:hypothetical protein